MSKKIFTKINHSELRTININTGEIVSAVTEIKCDSIDTFIFCFLNSIKEITHLDGNSIRVLLWCWKFSSFNLSLPTGNRIHNDATFRDEIRTMGGDLTDSVINKAFSILSKKRLLIKQGRGSYILNPKYFFKGNLSDRSKLKYILSYDGTENNTDTSAQPLEKE